MTSKEEHGIPTPSEGERIMRDITDGLHTAILAMENVSESLEDPAVPWSSPRRTVFLTHADDILAKLFHMTRATACVARIPT